MDPASKASYDCGAERADSSELWMLSSDGTQIYPLANSDFPGFKLPTRRIRARKNIYSQLGVRIGPNASGEYANRSSNRRCAPPAFPKSSQKEISGFLRARGQMGFPASICAVAGLG